MQINLPPKGTAEVIQSLVTSAGIVLTGTWVFWRWSLSEFIRHRREIPSFDGIMSARSVPINEGSDLLTVSCIWHNKSAIPLSVNTQATQFAVYELPENIPDGPVGPRMGNLVERYARRPWEHWPKVIMEPGTSSELQAHFVVPSQRPYIIMCRLEAMSKPKEDKRVWIREMIWEAGHDSELILEKAPLIEKTVT